jgi:hypothetical protein
MSRAERFWTVLPLTVILWLALVLAMLHHPHRARHDGEFRWDQEHLKAADAGCPTAIYVAPNGVLQPCP